MKKILFGLALSFLSPIISAAPYEIDRSHSEVGFSVKHLVISTVKGSFKDFSGEIDFDPKNVDKAKFAAKIKAASVFTNDEKRDEHLRNEDFFFTQKHPDILFKSTKVEGSKPEGFKVHGDLTMRGVTKPVVLDVTYNGEAKDPWGNLKAGFTAVTKINRKDFGIVWNKALDAGGVTVGDEVTIQLEIQAKKLSDTKKS
jgi:polyisoprenoid-binding protein YceI